MLVILLRLIGSASALALIAVFLPYQWMNVTHHWLGLGTLPPDPIVGYLARTLSAFYAFYGGLLWTLSFDTSKHRSTIRYIGFATLGFGLILLAVDWSEGLPFYWKIAEGPIVIVYGSMIVLLSRRSTN